MFSQLRRTVWKASLLGAILSLVGFSLALAASGDLDTTFGGDGRVTTDFSGNWYEEINAIALQSDGKIVAVGQREDPADLHGVTHDFAVARYNTDGSLDTNFSGDGKQLTNFGAAETAYNVAIQSDGKIVVSGEKCNSASICDLAVARYNTDGTLDTTFSGDGRHVVGFGSGDNAGGGGLAIRADGKIWIAGYMTNSSGDLDFAIYRLNSNGSLDTTFSGDGKLNGAFGVGKDDFARDLLIQPGGKVVIVGTTCAPGGDCDVALARMTAGGALDATFSGDGKQITNLGGDDDATGVARKSDGKIVVSGVRRIGDNASLIVARYNTDGTLDATFSGDGKQVVSIGPNSGAMDVRVQADGKIVMAGAAHDASYYDAVLVRLNTNGSLDTTFSGDGKLRVDFGGNEDMAAALVRQSDGKYVLAGATWDGTQLDFALARVLP